MGSGPTKAAGNVYCRCRLEASKYNDRLKSREGAAELLGVSASAMADYELGNVKVMPVDKVNLMADLYNAPELRNYYCTHDCPLGAGFPQLEISSADRAVLNFMAAYIDLKRSESDIEDLVIKAAEDGTITDKTMTLLSRTVERSTALSVRTQELMLWAEKNMKASKGGADNG